MNSQKCRASCWSSRDWCCSRRRRVLLVFLFVGQNGVFCWTSHLQVVKRRWKGNINARSKNGIYIQVVVFPVDFDIIQISGRHLIPVCLHILCTYTWKYFIPHFMCSLLVRVTGTRARCLSKNCCFWVNNKLQAARGISSEPNVISWSRSFTVRVTESGPK